MRKWYFMKNKDFADDGFYWATSVRRNKTKRRPWLSQVSGHRSIVRVFRFKDQKKLNVQSFGQEELFEITDFTDYDGPIGKGYFI